MVSHGSRNLLDDLNELIAPIPMMSGEADKFSCPFEHGIAAGRTAANGDATPTSKFDQPFVSQRSQCPEHGVVVDAQHCGEVACCWKSLSGLGLSIPYGASDLRGNLLV